MSEQDAEFRIERTGKNGFVTRRLDHPAHFDHHPPMARKKTSLIEDLFEALHELFMVVPSWTCIPIAGIMFFAVKLGVIWFAAAVPPFVGVSIYANNIAGFAAAGVLLVGGTAAIKKVERRHLLRRQEGIGTIRTLSWQEFELLVGEAYRQQGYQVTETGGGGADGGIDLKLERASEVVLVQCKQWKVYKVGVKPIRELFGVLAAEGATKAIFVTSGVFTQEAQTFAEGKPVELIDGEALEKLITSVRGVKPAPAKHLVAVEVQPSPASKEVPACPFCGSAMVLRNARKGANAGSQFWGCPGFPRCRGTRQTNQVTA